MADDHANEDKRFRDLVMAMFGLYQVIAILLAHLPIPIGVASNAGNLDADELNHLFDTLIRARKELIKDQPILDSDKGPLAAMLLDWMTAFDMCAVMSESGVEPWRLDALDWACKRVADSLKELTDRYVS